MSLADLDALVARMTTPHERLFFSRPISGTGAPYSARWINNGGAAPATNAVCSRTTVGGLGQRNPATTLRIIAIDSTVFAASASHPVLLIDRLVHTAGLDGTSTAVQTVNLPTPALTRYTNGAGVMAAITVYSAAGNLDPNTFTCSYTNQAGTSGRTAEASYIGRPNVADDMFVMNLQLGDTGVRSVESVTLAATSGAVGNLGVILFKPLLMIPTAGGDAPLSWDTLSLGGICPKVETDACLSLTEVTLDTTNASNRNVIISLGEE